MPALASRSELIAVADIMRAEMAPHLLKGW
jgi:hypothetical protein